MSEALDLLPENITGNEIYAAKSRVIFCKNCSGQKQAESYSSAITNAFWVDYGVEESDRSDTTITYKKIPEIFSVWLKQ